MGGIRLFKKRLRRASGLARRLALRLAPAVCALLAASALARAADDPACAGPSEAESLVVAGEREGDVMGFGRTVVVEGRVSHGVVALGGDVLVRRGGRVEGDAGAVGGSVVQCEGSFVGGDVIVLGGRYRHGDAAPERRPAGKTLMYAGYERELRESLRDPTSILTPKLSAAYLGWRLLAVLFWLVVSLAFTAVSPGAVGRAAARLQLKSLRVAVVGLLAALAWLGLMFSLSFLPSALGLAVLVAALVLQAMSYLFGRVVIHAATGRWLQRLLLAEKNRSEAVALFLGALFWSVALALPYVWPFLAAGLVVTSLGLALTARHRVNWKRA